jgi:hypothetical protein
MTQYTTYNQICIHFVFQKLEIMGQKLFFLQLADIFEAYKWHRYKKRKDKWQEDPQTIKGEGD